MFNQDRPCVSPGPSWPHAISCCSSSSMEKNEKMRSRWRVLWLFLTTSVLALAVWLIWSILLQGVGFDRNGVILFPRYSGRQRTVGLVPSKQGARSLSRERFEAAYEGHPPWDIAGPQPAVVELEKAGMIRGTVLDVGCGTGEIALYLSSRGHVVLGLDFVAVAIERAKAKAKERGLIVQFQVGDALKLDQLGRTFDTVIDSGLFHTFSNEDRHLYVSGLSEVVRPGGYIHILCFSDQEPPGRAPRRVTQKEIRDAFSNGWQVAEIRESRFQTTEQAVAGTFSHGDPKAWLASISRTGK